MDFKKIEVDEDTYIRYFGGSLNLHLANLKSHAGKLSFLLNLETHF